jgi:uncharacterized glyoxalase superfamily protein PhnB
LFKTVPPYAGSVVTMRNTIFASMRYRDCGAAIDWLERAFGFERHVVYDSPDGTVAHAELANRPSGSSEDGHSCGLVMVGSWRGDDDHPRPGQGWAYVVVEDLDAHHARAREAGAEIAQPPTHQDYGSFYGAYDPEGNLWSFGTYQPDAP